MNYGNSNYGNAMAGIGAQVAQTSAPPQPGVLTSIETSLENALNRIHANAADLRAVADRVLGTQPEAVTACGAKTPADPPQLRRIADLAEYLQTATEELGNQVTRLHRL